MSARFGLLALVLAAVACTEPLAAPSRATAVDQGRGAMCEYRTNKGELVRCPSDGTMRCPAPDGCNLCFCSPAGTLRGCTTRPCS